MVVPLERKQQKCFQVSLLPEKVGALDIKARKKLEQREASLSSSSATNTSASACSSPPKSPSYEELKEPTTTAAAKMQYLSVRKLSDDEFSEADSMTRYIFFTDTFTISYNPILTAQHRAVG